MEIAVCSWSYRLSAERVAEEMTKCDVKNVHLALNPFVDPKAIVPGTAGETENVAGTGGLVPDEYWEENRAIIAKVVKLTAEWKSPYMMLHAGYIDPSDKAGHAKLTDRLKYVRDLCADEGIGLTLETGQETADDLAEMLTNLPGVYVNFDPANMILYGKGDPVRAVKILAPWIRHIHIKDANYSKVPGTWGEEVAWTQGQVNADAFLSALGEIGYDGCLAVEREAGNDRPGDIARAVAVCDANLSQLTAKVEGNIKGAADNTALPKSVAIYDDFAKMLAAGGFDIVDITLPTLLHPPMTIAALKAGYHVLCEKPMALDLKDCDRMLAAAKAARRQLLVAHCVRFFPENAYVRELVKSGRYGKVVAADFTRFIAPPKWSPKGADWFFDEKKSGGVLFDAHVHDADYILGTFGRPLSVSATFHTNGRGFVDHTTATYRYRDALVTSDSSFAAAASLVWDASGRIFFEKATVYFGPFYKKPLTVYPQEGKPFSPKLSKRTGYEAEIRYFLQQVERDAPGEILTARDARDSIALLASERKSATSGRAVAVKK